MGSGAEALFKICARMIEDSGKGQQGKDQSNHGKNGCKLGGKTQIHKKSIRSLTRQFLHQSSSGKKTASSLSLSLYYLPRDCSTTRKPKSWQLFKQ